MSKTEVRKMEEPKTEMTKVAKVLRLRDITYAHLKAANPRVTGAEIDALDRDVKVWVKNLLLALDEVDANAVVSFVGD
jgi:hypothetical protein